MEKGKHPYDEYNLYQDYIIPQKWGRMQEKI